MDANYEEAIDKRLEYLYEMLEKYSNLNQEANYRFNWRQHAIDNQIEILEDIKENKSFIRKWDECYKEDLEESNKK